MYGIVILALLVVRTADNITYKTNCKTSVKTKNLDTCFLSTRTYEV